MPHMCYLLRPVRPEDRSDLARRSASRVRARTGGPSGKPVVVAIYNLSLRSAGTRGQRGRNTTDTQGSCFRPHFASAIPHRPARTDPGRTEPAIGKEFSNRPRPLHVPAGQNRPIVLAWSTI
ncbi:hypothetical protein GCM10010240_42790 [Streptomyces griseoviridis]|nr:hypothetical protein GCM10010240_42790 [Streptomyces griseoviridis]